MAKQILVGIKKQSLNEVAHYLMIYFPYNEEMCSYANDWLGELYENKYPLVSKGMWSGIIDLKTHKLLDWIEKPDFSDFIEDSETVEKIDTSIEEETILDIKVEFTYSQLMANLLRLPKYLQMEIGKTLIANASEGFEKDVIGQK